MSALANGKRELVFGDEHARCTAALIQYDLLHFGRGQGIAGQFFGVIIPFNDVYFLAAEFLNDRGYADAFLSHHGSHRIYAGVMRDHGDFGAQAGLPRHGFYLHHARRDFRHFQFKQFFQQPRMRARQKHARTLGVLFHKGDEHFEAFANAVPLARHLLFRRQDACGSADVNKDIAAFQALYQAAHDLTFLVFVLVKHGGAFGLADALENDLFGGLCRNPAVFCICGE